MNSVNEFNQMKQTLQTILDNHLPYDKKVSVENFDKEQVWYLCKLLLEKDDKKRDLIRKDLDAVVKNMMDNFKNDLNEIERKKSELDNYIWTREDADELVNDVIRDCDFDTDIKDI